MHERTRRYDLETRLLVMKHAKFFLIILFSASVAANSFAQFPDVSKAFTTYKSKYPATRLHLTFNQPFYAPGDTIFFSAWHLDESQKAFPGRQVGTVDLVAEDGHAVKRIHFKIEDGRGTNQLALPKDLDPGSYTVIAYTAWMRNFNDGWFYRKRIEVKGKNDITSAPAPMAAGVEGGTLVAGITNHIVVTADYPGATVTIRNQSGEEVVSGSLDSTGVASIDFTPRADAIYTVTGPNSSKAQLSAVKAEGVVMKFSGDAFTLTSTGQYQDKELMALFVSQGKVLETRRVKLAGGNGTLSLPGFMNGLYQQVYVMDQAGTVVAERVFASNLSTNDMGTLSVPANVSQREPVTVTIDLRSAAELSVTAYQEKLFNTVSLKHGFYLAELPDVLLWAEKHDKYQQSLNTFLVTQHWSRINWTEILSTEKKKLSFPNYSILTEKGLVRSRTSGEPAPDSTNVIVYLQKNTMGYDTYTRGGRFEIPFAFDFWDTDYLFVALQRNSRDVTADYEVVFDSDSIQVPAIAPGRQMRTESVYGSYALNKKLISSSYTYFGSGARTNDTIRSLNAVFEDELGEIDAVVDVEKFVVFPTMEDLLREVIPFVQYRKKGMAEGVRMMLAYPQGNRVSKSHPLFVVDGVMTRDPKFFMKIKPKDITTVKIVNDPNRLQQLGKIGENGVLLLESKKGNLSDSLRQATNHAVTGLNPSIPFRDVARAKTSSQRIPDLRSTLFWQPKATPDNTGRLELAFTTGDDVGPVKIIVQGLTPEGVPVYLEKETTIKFQRQP